MRFVHDQDVLVPIEDVDLERHPRFDGRVAVQVDEPPGSKSARLGDSDTLLVDDLPGCDLLPQSDGVLGEPFELVVERRRPHAVVGLTDATGVQAVADGKR